MFIPIGLAITRLLNPRYLYINPTSTYVDAGYVDADYVV